jgi:hypothetical protein
MTRLGLVAVSATVLAACGGLPPATHPLFIARPAASASQDIGSPRITVEMNDVVLGVPGSTATGCSFAGDYVRKGSSVEVELRQGPGAAPCGGQGPFITRIGPLPPGEYQVTVMLDGKPLISAERAVIS